MSEYNVQEVRKARVHAMELMDLLVEKLLVSEERWSWALAYLRNKYLEKALGRWSQERTRVVSGIALGTIKKWKREVEWKSV